MIIIIVQYVQVELSCTQTDTHTYTERNYSCGLIITWTLIVQWQTRTKQHM